MTALRITFAGYQGPESVHSRAAAALGDSLARRTGGAAVLEIRQNVIAEGRRASDLLDMVGTGKIDLCYFSTSYLADRVPEFALLDLPFVLEDRAAAYRLLDGPLADLLAEGVRRSTPYALLGLWDNGIRHLSNRVRPIRTPADCRGLLIRTLFSDLHEETFRRLGFETVRLDVKELQEAVRGGTVDAQDNALTNIANFGIHRHQPHITLSGHFFGAAAVLGHAPGLDRWPPDIRDALAAAVADATPVQRALAAAEDGDALRRIRAEGGEIVEIDADQRRAFVEAVRPVIDGARRDLGNALFRLLA